ncbi:uncharacterized protein YegL [Streptomyces sp. CG 926]|uniref:vWA domain-containing protein n=1 Tax=Streptomyces sp. CG 926 TaxID=1882405 RepID=UPI000D7A5A4C|nr:vWA domain-containing protein [Streptomyces sp. CG 926]PWK65219.1 uncharacterized protein YegL [Streptomyces sp. CG 926]
MSAEASDGRERAFPFYVVCDVSQSMWKEGVYKPSGDAGRLAGRTPYDALCEAVPDLLWKLQLDATACDAAHISVVTFAESPRTVVPLARPDTVNHIDSLPKGSQTDYAKVLAHLARQVDQDCRELEREYALKRPTVFFLTDGDPYVGSARQPDDAWLPYRAQLVGLKWAPQVAAFGFGNVRPATLVRLATPAMGDGRQSRPMAFRSTAQVSVSDLLEALIDTLFISISASVSEDKLDLRVPEGMQWLA